MTAKIDTQMLSTLTLGHGSGGPDPCVMEAISLLTGEQRTDNPACVAPSLIVMGIRLNDWATEEQRQTLKAFVARLIGTAGDDAAEDRRKYLCIDAAVREFAPLWLERAGLTEWARRLRGLPEIVDKAGARGAYEQAYAATHAANAANPAHATYVATYAANAAYAAANATHAAHAANAATHAANAANAANAATYAEMGIWERVRALYDRMIRAGETPLGIADAADHMGAVPAALAVAQ